MKFSDASYQSKANRYVILSDVLDVRNTKAIINREISLQANLSNEKFETSIQNQGSASFQVMNNLVKNLLSISVIPKLSGNGLELGAGSALFSIALLSNDEAGEIQQIIAVEAAKEYAEAMINRASSEYLGDKACRVAPALGIFEQLNLDDECLDFVIQFEALHHANDPFIPPQESFRLLKPGGLFISVDRSWPNGTSEKIRQQLLDHLYETVWLEKKGFPADKPFSRRDNGEHEYTDSEWRTFFESAGFETLTVQPISPFPDIKTVLKRFIGILRIEKLFKVKISARSGLIRALLSRVMKNKVLFRGGQIITTHPRPLVVFIFRKPQILDF